MNYDESYNDLGSERAGEVSVLFTALEKDLIEFSLNHLICKEIE